MSALADTEPARSADLERLIERLGEPRTAAALNTLLDNIELIAVLVAGLDGLARKGDLISDTVAEVISQVRAASDASGMKPGETTRQLATVIPALADASPAIRRLSESAIVDPDSITVVGLAGQAMSNAYESARPGDGIGLGGMLRATRDPDVKRGLGFVIELAREFGRSLDRDELRKGTTPTASA